MSRNYKSQLMRLCFVLPMVLLSACGDDDAEPVVVVNKVVIKTGSFKDSAVSGINYSTATQSGTTNSQGQFDYIEGEEITFSIGSIILPSAPADFILTPIDLVGDGATSSNETVLNIASFLQTIDSDNDPSNGIEISEEAVNAASTAIDFTDTTFRNSDSPAQLYIDSLNRDIDGVPLVLVSSDSARAHLLVTLSEIEESDFSSDFLSGNTFSINHSGNAVAELYLNSEGQTGTITYSSDVINTVTDWSVIDEGEDAGQLTFIEYDEVNNPTVWEFIEPTVINNQAVYTYNKLGVVNDATGTGTMTLVENAFIPNFIKDKTFLLTHRTSTYNLSFVETTETVTDEDTGESSVVNVPNSGTMTYHSPVDPDSPSVGFTWSIDLGVLTITETHEGTDTTTWVFTAESFTSEEEAEYNFTLSGKIGDDSFAEIGKGNMAVITN